MWGRHTDTAVRAGVLSLLMVLSVVAFAPIGSAQQDNPVSDGQTFEVTDDVDVWERSIFPLRAETDDAAATIPNADWRVRVSGTGEASVNKDPVAVYEPGTEVEFEFDLSRARADTSQFRGSEVDVIAAHVEESTNTTAPRTLSAARNLLDPSAANENATFEEVESGATLGPDGNLEFTHTPADSGFYVYFVATDSDGFEVSDGDLRVNDQTTVVGMDAIAVRKGTGHVWHDGPVEPGDSIEFDVNASELAGDEIRQAVVVYDEETFVRQSFVVEMPDNVSTDFDTVNDTVLETSVDAVNGQARLEDDIDMFGMRLNDGEVTRSAEVETIVDFVGDSANAPTPEVRDRSNDDIVMDGSATAISRSGGDQTIEVQTLDNWSSGEYRWVYLAVGQNSSEMVMDTGTIDVGDVDEDEGKDKDKDRGDDRGEDEDKDRDKDEDRGQDEAKDEDDDEDRGQDEEKDEDRGDDGHGGNESEP